MLSRLLGLILLAAVVGLVALNFQSLLTFGQYQMVHNDAKRLIQAGNWSRAIPLYEEGLKQNPENTLLAHRLGWLYVRSNQPEKAEALYRRILQTQPDNADVRAALADLLRQDAERRDEAVDEFRSALAKHPRDARLLSRIGDMYKDAAEDSRETRDSVRKWLYDQARYYYQHALQTDPRQFQTQFNLGVAYQQQLNLQPAARAYCESILLKPDSYEARFNLGLVLSELEYLNEAYRQMDYSVQLAAEQADERTMRELARRVQNVKNSIFNSDRSALAEKADPAFLNPACLFRLDKTGAETPKKH